MLRLTGEYAGALQRLGGASRSNNSAPLYADLSLKSIGFSKHRFFKTHEAIVSTLHLLGRDKNYLSAGAQQRQRDAEAGGREAKSAAIFVSKYENGERRVDIIEFLYLAHAIGFDPISFMRKVLKSR
jgi:hypothetical protein